MDLQSNFKTASCDSARPHANLFCRLAYRPLVV